MLPPEPRRHLHDLCKRVRRSQQHQRLRHSLKGLLLRHKQPALQILQRRVCVQLPRRTNDLPLQARLPQLDEQQGGAVLLRLENACIRRINGIHGQRRRERCGFLRNRRQQPAKGPRPYVEAVDPDCRPAHDSALRQTAKHFRLRAVPIHTAPRQQIVIASP